MTTTQNLAFNAVIHGMVACSYWLVPSLRITGQYFGVTVPEEFRSSDEGRVVARRFRWTVAGWMAAAMGLQALQPEGVMPLISLVVMLCGATYAMMQARKAVAPHGMETPVVRTASMTPDGNSLPGGLFGAVGPFVLVAAAAVYLQLNWATLPDRFPPSYVARMDPGAWVEKSFTSVFGPLMYAFCLLLALSLTRVGIAEGTPAGDEGARRFRRFTLRSQAVGLWLLGLITSYHAVARFSAEPPVPPSVGLAVVAAVTLATMWLMKLGSMCRKMMRISDAPSRRAAVTKSSVRSERKRPRTTRASWWSRRNT